MSNLNLTPTENKRFQTALKRARIDVKQASNLSVSVPDGAQWTLPADGAKFEMTTRTVQTLADLNKIIGAPEDIFKAGTSRDSAHDYACKVSAGDAETCDDLGPDEALDVQSTRNAYLFGHSGKVTADAEQLVNQLQFPAQVHFIGAMNVALGSDAVLTFGGRSTQPYVVVLGTLSIGKGAQIKITVDTSFNVQVCESKN